MPRRKPQFEQDHPNDYHAWLHRLLTRAQRRALDRFDGPIDRTEAVASRLAALALEELRQQEGGIELYLPVRDKTERNAAIAAEFNGRNAAAVCQRHGISRTSLYRIVGSASSEKSRFTPTNGTGERIA